MDDAPKRRITLEVDYPERDVVGLVTETGTERGYLVAGEDGALRFVPEFDRKPDAASSGE